MCICLNCYRIDNCSIYMVVALKHKEHIRTVKKMFYPQSPILFGLNKFSKINSFLIEWDISECLSYQDKPGNWLFSSSPKLTIPISYKFSSYLVYDLLF
uniref:Uncharacterized protein n=1 Tax=Protohalopteris sp. TaxID=2843287 RepID=A0A8F0F7I1_9PHAE|nr:hypothetical protein [Protohalopteris sp.]